MTNPPDSDPQGPSEWERPSPPPPSAPTGGQWHSPSEPTSSSPQPPSQPAPPPAGAPEPQPPPNQGPMVTQPGIIPFRPLNLGEIYSGAFKAIRANPVVMFGLSAAVIALTTIVDLVMTATVAGDSLAFLDQISSDPESIETMAVTDFPMLSAGGVGVFLIAQVVIFIGQTILTGVLTFTVSQSILGFKPSLGQVWRECKGQMVRLVLLVLLISLIMFAGVVVVMLFMFIAVASTNTAVVVLGILLGLLALFAWLVVVFTFTSLATPALMLERATVLTALQRSWRLTKPALWRVFGILALTYIITIIVTSMLATPFSMIGAFLPLQAALVMQTIVGALASMVVTPFLASVTALIYVDQRMRREGLAAELAAASQ